MNHLDKNTARRDNYFLLEEESNKLYCTITGTTKDFKIKIFFFA